MAQNILLFDFSRTAKIIKAISTSWSSANQNIIKKLNLDEKFLTFEDSTTTFAWFFQTIQKKSLKEEILLEAAETEAEADDEEAETKPDGEQEHQETGKSRSRQSQQSKPKSKFFLTIQQVLKAVVDTEAQVLKTTKTLFKHLIVIKKCQERETQLLSSTKCKMCEMSIELENLADHSFCCLERQRLHSEMDHINKLIVKLRTSLQKIKATLCSLAI